LRHITRGGLDGRRLSASSQMDGRTTGGIRTRINRATRSHLPAQRSAIRLRTREGMKVASAKGRLRGKQPKLKPSQTKHLLELPTQRTTPKPNSPNSSVWGDPRCTGPSSERDPSHQNRSGHSHTSRIHQASQRSTCRNHEFLTTCGQDPTRPCRLM
jgi:hypothetical protein